MTQSVEGCFGETDLVFAGHPNDEDRAFKLLTDCRKNGIGWAKVEADLREHLASEGAADTHIDQQIKKAKDAMKFWLLD